ncbi:hypothetical protein D3C71_1328620 [compost metagenome]
MPIPAVTANAPIQSCLPLSAGAMKSVRQKSGRSTGLSTCWRRKCRTAGPSSVRRCTSSPTLLAGHSPNTALAVSHFSSTMRASIARASRYNSLAWVPTISSVRMAGYLPASSQAWKNGVQSITWTRSSKG